MKTMAQITASALVLMSFSVLTTAAAEEGAGRTSTNIIDLARPDASVELGGAVVVDRYAGYSDGEVTFRNTASAPIMIEDIASLAELEIMPGVSLRFECSGDYDAAFGISGARAYDTVPCGSLVRIREGRFSSLLEHELTDHVRQRQQTGLQAYLETARAFYGDTAGISGRIDDHGRLPGVKGSRIAQSDGLMRPAAQVSCCGIAVHGTVMPIYTQSGYVSYVWFVGQNFSGNTKSVENNRATATGTLRSSVWARETPYNGSDTFSGFRMAQSSSNWGTLPAGEWYADFDDNMTVLANHPDSGWWYVYTLVDEWESGAWVWVHLTGSSTTQVGVGSGGGSSGGGGSGSSSSGCTVVSGGSNPNNPLFLLLLLGALAYLARVAGSRKRKAGED